MSFRFYRQRDSADCGPACLRMIARHYGKKVDSEFIKAKTFATKDGVNLFDLSQTAKLLGFDALCAQLTLEKVIESDLGPAILFWNKNHFIVLFKIKVKKSGERVFYIADPSVGKIAIDE